MGVFDDPPEPTDQPKEKQQVHILSAASFPPPPYIEEITELAKSTDYELLIEDMPMFIPDLFAEEEYVELCNVSAMLKEYKCICSRPEVFIPEATPQIEDLTAIVSREWTKEAESSCSIIQIYCDFRILLCYWGRCTARCLLRSKSRGECDVQNNGRTHCTRRALDFLS
jgi:hypothetical protein